MDTTYEAYMDLIAGIQTQVDKNQLTEDKVNEWRKNHVNLRKASQKYKSKGECATTLIESHADLQLTLTHVPAILRKGAASYLKLHSNLKTLANSIDSATNTPFGIRSNIKEILNAKPYLNSYNSGLNLMKNRNSLSATSPNKPPTPGKPSTPSQATNVNPQTRSVSHCIVRKLTTEEKAEENRKAMERELLEKAEKEKSLQEAIEKNLKQIQEDQANQEPGNLEVSLYSPNNYLFQGRRDNLRSKEDEVQNELVNCGLSSPATVSNKTPSRTQSQAQNQQNDDDLIEETLSFQIATYKRLIAKDNDIERTHKTMAKLEKAMAELKRIQQSQPSKNLTSNPNTQAKVPTTQPNLNKELIQKELRHYRYTLDKIKRYNRHITVLETHLETGTTPRTLDRNRFPQAFNKQNPDLNEEINKIITNAQTQMMQATVRFLKQEKEKLSEHAREKEETLNKQGAEEETKKTKEAIEKDNEKDKVAMDKVEKRVKEKELKERGENKEEEEPRGEKKKPNRPKERYQRQEKEGGKEEGRQGFNHRSRYNSGNHNNGTRSYNNNYRSNHNNHGNSYGNRNYKPNLAERLSFPENHPYRK
jgi:hypothetical protein